MSLLLAMKCGLNHQGPAVLPPGKQVELQVNSKCNVEIDRVPGHVRNT